MARGGFPNMGGANMQQLMRQAQKTDCEREERRKRGAPVIFLLGMRLRAV